MKAGGIKKNECLVKFDEMIKQYRGRYEMHAR
jgi:hypothetical protein